MNRYLTAFTDVKGDVLFIDQKEGNTNTAFRIINDTAANFDKITNLVTKGNTVTTRADANTV